MEIAYSESQHRALVNLIKEKYKTIRLSQILYCFLGILPFSLIFCFIFSGALKPPYTILIYGLPLILIFLSALIFQAKYNKIIQSIQDKNYIVERRVCIATRQYRYKRHRGGIGRVSSSVIIMHIILLEGFTQEYYYDGCEAICKGVECDIIWFYCNNKIIRAKNNIFAEWGNTKEKFDGIIIKSLS